MTYSVEISKQAETDFRGIYEYIAVELKSPSNALNLLNKLEENISSLDNMPKRFKKYDAEPWKSRGMRKMNVDNFVVMYIPDDDKLQVTVIRVFYGGRNIDAEMRENTII